MARSNAVVAAAAAPEGDALASLYGSKKQSSVKKKAGKKRREDPEPILHERFKMTSSQRAALVLHAALHDRFFDQTPVHIVCWEKYVLFCRWQRFGNIAVNLLLALSLFETPLWCNQTGYWSYLSAAERCQVPGKASGEQLIMSGVFLLPIGVGVIIEVVLLLIVCWYAKLQVDTEYVFGKSEIGMPTNRYADVSAEITAILVAVADVCFFVYRRGQTSIRVAPYARFCLAVILVPKVRKTLKTFISILLDLRQIAAFLLGSIFIFAWTSAMIFNDFKDREGNYIVDRFGDPVSSGLDSFGHAMYTAWLTVTTANLPDALVFSYTYSRAFIWIWLPYILLTSCVFVQVILAIVYNTYQEDLGCALSASFKGRAKAVHMAFLTLCTHDQHVDAAGNQEDELVITSAILLHMLECFNVLDYVDLTVIDVIFESLDDDNSGMLSKKEFEEICDVIQYDYKVTKCESRLARLLPAYLTGLLQNQKHGENMSYTYRFEGSFFCKLMNWVLTINCCFMVIESYFDLNDSEPLWFQWIDFFFSFIYIFEVASKLLVWSWEEYWVDYGNRFDFVSTMILSGTGLLALGGLASPVLLRYFNLLRILRLLKALGNIVAFRATFMTISRMVSTCADVALMSFLVLYLWSALGVQLFGGEMFADNPVFDSNGVNRTASGDPALDYFTSNLLVFNFNDMLLGIITLFFFMICGWVDQVATVCLATSAAWSVKWLVTLTYMLSFYVASTMLAFNVFTAFSIDVYCQLEELHREPEPDDDDDDQEPDRVCACGSTLKADAQFCRLCGQKWQGDTKELLKGVPPEWLGVAHHQGDILLRGMPPSWGVPQIKLAFALIGGLEQVNLFANVQEGDETRSARVRLRDPMLASRAVERLHQVRVGDGEFLEPCELTCVRLGKDPRSATLEAAGDGDDDEDTGEDALFRNLKDLEQVLWAKGLCLHVSASAEAERLKVYKSMFEDQLHDK